ncbi:MAG: hypothetical protein B7Z44_14485 [Caulobacter sp. 12-67-6]|nr:MAG: hypothetical protein B7Z44_14485 [Caulobacter sp. 12-67-6]OYX73820.1 MAG: hypothetical protein B7Y81_01570 [Caulobacter sp. 32-67-35]OYX96905.1 MAG: hypothetical protein B7Y78_02870 [Caulobacter sp. 35-67-4]
MQTRLTRPLVLAALTLALGACATAAPERSGFLSGYEGLAARDNGGRARIREFRDEAALNSVRRVALTPAVLSEGADSRSPLTPDERRAVLREVDAQLCFELSERFEIVGAEQADADVRAAITWFEPTGRIASAASAASGFFIPGPIGLRAPGTLGGLGVEAEMRKTSDQRQIAAIAWARRAMAVGTDNPSLSRLGDALQFAEPFADTAAAVMTPKGLKSRDIDAKTDPCKAYGNRFQPGGMVARMITNLYIPDSRGEAAAKPASPEK